MQQHKNFLLHHQAIFFYVDIQGIKLVALHLLPHLLLLCSHTISMTPLDLREKRKSADDESDFEYFTSGKLFIICVHTQTEEGKKFAMKIKLLLELFAQ